MAHFVEEKSEFGPKLPSFAPRGSLYVMLLRTACYPPLSHVALPYYLIYILLLAWCTNPTPCSGCSVCKFGSWRVIYYIIILRFHDQAFVWYKRKSENGAHILSEPSAIERWSWEDWCAPNRKSELTRFLMTASYLRLLAEVTYSAIQYQYRYLLLVVGYLHYASNSVKPS